MAEYVIKVLLCQAILYLFYHFSLAKEKMHHFNRFYLVFSLLFSITIPLIKIPAYFPTAINFSSILFSAYNPEPISVDQTVVKGEQGSFPISKWFTIMYILPFLFFTIRMIRNLFRINLVAMVYEKIEYKGYEVILAENKILPYSFLNRIFVNRHDYENGKIGDELFMHEIYHIQQRHSIDILIVEIIQAIFWFNPLLILHNRAIRLNHEYLADNSVINNQVQLSDYQKILVDAVSKQNLLPITSGFSATWTKKRLLMMTKSKSMLSTSIRIFLAVPVIFIIAVSFIFSDESNETKAEREAHAIFNAYPNFCGTWVGNGWFYNCSLHEQIGEIQFKLTINEDKTIEGKVGNAILREIQIEKARHGFDITARVSRAIKENEIIDKEFIVILWSLPEMEQNKVNADFRLQNNLLFDAFLNAGGVELTKTEKE